MSAWGMQPEVKHERVQEVQRGVVQRLRSLLGDDVTLVMLPDELEGLALQLKLAATCLIVSARELREVEEERRFLAREMSREAMRFEAEQAGSLCHDERRSA